ncbi:MAG: hypothetical protein CM15mV67_020 [uncultured marine virus]|nr:MAG: hypothetical protein CM15mV67_020 [uncultured marine virus]
MFIYLDAHGYRTRKNLESEALMKLLFLKLLGLILWPQVSLIIAFHTSHLIVSVLFFFKINNDIWGYPKHE